jgi:hypothetical protein
VGRKRQWITEKTTGAVTAYPGERGATNCDILCAVMHSPLDTTMLRKFALVLLLGLLPAACAMAADAHEVVVTGPYLDLRTGPGRGYPVTQSVPRGARVVVLFQRTDWYKVRTDKGREGWAHRSQLQQTRTPGVDAGNHGGPDAAERMDRRHTVTFAGQEDGQEVDA